jgi:hypothetical protein
MTISRILRASNWMDGAAYVLGLCGVFILGEAVAAPVVVLTSYPEELTTAYEKAY